MLIRLITSLAVLVTQIPLSSPLAADPTLYGRLRLGILVSDVENEDTNSDLFNASSRFGIKGIEDLGNGLEAVYRFEFGVNADQGSIRAKDRQRKSYVGLKGDFGQLTIGTNDSAVEIVSDYIDPTQNIGDNINPFSGRVDNLIQYGISANDTEIMIGVKLDNDDRASDGIDAYYSSLQFFTGGLTVGIFHEHIGHRDVQQEDGTVIEEVEEEVDRIGAGLIYEFSQFRIGMLYAQEDNGSEDDYSGYGVSLDYAISDDLSLAVVYQASEDEDDLSADAKYYLLSGKYSLSVRTSLFAEYLKSNFSSDEDSRTDDLLVGIRHDF